MKNDIYKNLLIIVGGILIFYYFFQLPALLYVSLFIAVFGALIPPVAKAINWFWMKLAFVLGWINSRILLSLIFFLFLMPIAWVSRLFTKDPLLLKKQKNSLYQIRNHTYQKEDLENIW